MIKRHISNVIRSAVAMTAVLVWAVPTVSANQSVAGKWQVKAEGGAHGTVDMTLVIALGKAEAGQVGTRVTAQLNPGHGEDIPMTGTWVNGALTLETRADDDGNKIMLKGTLKDDGTMSGFLSSVMGDMTWIGTKAKTLS